MNLTFLVLEMGIIIVPIWQGCRRIQQLNPQVPRTVLIRLEDLPVWLVGWFFEAEFLCVSLAFLELTL